MEVVPIGGPLGAEIRGVDLAWLTDDGSVIDDLARTLALPKVAQGVIILLGRRILGLRRSPGCFQLGDVRGRGLFQAIEFVADRQTRARFPDAQAIGTQIGRRALELATRIAEKMESVV